MSSMGRMLNISALLARLQPQSAYINVGAPKAPSAKWKVESGVWKVEERIAEKRKVVHNSIN